jgi:hypothetical protein
LVTKVLVDSVVLVIFVLKHNKMIITVKMKGGPVTTIDTEVCSHPSSIREALVLALKLDGCDESIIDQVFNREKVTTCKSKPEPLIVEEVRLLKI